MEALFRTTDDRKRRDRVPIVRMAHRGRARQDIAADVGVHRRTVTRWVNAYGDVGLDGRLTVATLQERTTAAEEQVARSVTLELVRVLLNSDGFDAEEKQELIAEALAGRVR